MTETTPEAFAADFDRLVPTLLQEWPELDREALDATGGDLDQVVGLVAQATGRTKTLARKQVAELWSLLEGERPLLGRLEQMVEGLEARARSLAEEHDIADRGRQLFDQAEEKVREDPLKALLWTLGIGFFLGLFFGVGRGR
jgi:ElaB/YqjD/DUF883 family membrane-anchored ribosome-binding protein